MSSLSSYFTFSKDGVARLLDSKASSGLKTRKGVQQHISSNTVGPSDEKEKESSPLTLSRSRSVSLPAAIQEKQQRSKKINETQIKRENIASWSGFSHIADPTDENVQSQLNMIKLRAAMDPTHFYRKGTVLARKNQPFQIGTILDSPMDGASNRVPKKERGAQSWTSVLLQDEKIKASIKNRLAKVYANHKGSGKGTYKKKLWQKKKYAS